MSGHNRFKFLIIKYIVVNPERMISIYIYNIQSDKKEKNKRVAEDNERIFCFCKLEYWI